MVSMDSAEAPSMHLLEMTYKCSRRVPVASHDKQMDTQLKPLRYSGKRVHHGHLSSLGSLVATQVHKMILSDQRLERRENLGLGNGSARHRELVEARGCCDLWSLSLPGRHRTQDQVIMGSAIKWVGCAWWGWSFS